MKLFLILLLIAIMAALVRGTISFLKVTEEDLKGDTGPSAAALRSNKMMQQRILFQGVAIAIVALLLLMASSS